MTKLELNSRYLDAKNLVECFPLIEITIHTTSGEPMETKLTYVSQDKFNFIPRIHRFKIDNQIFERTYTESDKITLDLSTSNPNIYKLMEHGFEVDIGFSNGKVETYDLNDMNQKIELLEELRDSASQIKSINILDLDKLEGVEINDD